MKNLPALLKQKDSNITAVKHLFLKRAMSSNKAAADDLFYKQGNRNHLLFLPVTMYHLIHCTKNEVFH